MNQKAIIFIGRSGSGKGTQAKLVKEFLEKQGMNTLYIGTGDHFRKIMEEKDYTASIIKDVYDKGGRHPDFLAITMLGNIFRFEYKQGQSVIIDGAARSFGEAKVIMDILLFYGFTDIKIVYLNVSNEWCVEKLRLRGRGDDTQDVFEKKHIWFEKDVKPAIEFFRTNQHVDFIDVNGERNIEEISHDIISRIKNG